MDPLLAKQEYRARRDDTAPDPHGDCGVTSQVRLRALEPPVPKDLGAQSSSPPCPGPEHSKGTELSLHGDLVPAAAKGCRVGASPWLLLEAAWDGGHRDPPNHTGPTEMGSHSHRDPMGMGSHRHRSHAHRDPTITLVQQSQGSHRNEGHTQRSHGNGGPRATVGGPNVP